MSVYNDAHALASSLRQSVEYQTYKMLEEKVTGDYQAKEMLENFRRQHFEVQRLQMLGREVEESRLIEIQDLQQTVMANSLIAEFMTAEYKLTQMMADIYKILGEALDLNLDGIK